MTILLVPVLSTMLSLIYGQDCNGNYEPLPNLGRRARNYAVAENEPFVFDENLDSNKWYTVGKSNMPTNYSSLNIGICGTYYPIWMNGSVPKEVDGVVTRTACIVSFSSSCSVEKTIQVRNCTTHMIYKLEPTTQTSAYCFDILPEMPDIKPAPSFKPSSAEVKHELVFVDATSAFGNLPIKQPKLIFSCKFNKSNDATMLYTITWYVNEAFLEKKGPVLYTNVRNTDLNESELCKKGFKLGTTIKCSVRVSITMDGILGNVTTSSGFWIGIKILTPAVVMKQGGTAIVRLQPTVAFGCVKFQKDPGCYLAVQLYDDRDSYDCTASSVSVRNSDQCGAYIHGSTFQQSQAGFFFYEETNITITTKDKQDYNQGRNLFHLRLKTPKDGPVNDIMLDSYLGDISASIQMLRVQVEEERTWIGKNCYAHIDPHMMTFDQKSYENQNLGEFVMYRHSEFKQEVQMKTFECQGAKCACAASIRAGGELFIINVCRMPSLINHAHCGEKLMNIRKIHEYKYEIHMPLGTMVVVDIINWPPPSFSLNIDIAPSVKDVNKTVGLCGTLNNNAYDDFTMPSGRIEADNRFNEFSNSWKIDSSKSFLEPSNQKPDNWEEQFYLCVCPAALKTSTTPGTVSGSSRDPMCSPSVYQACTKKTVFSGKEYNDNHCNVISKRSLISQTKEIQRILSSKRIEDGTTFHIHSVTKRSSNNYTMEEAKSTCEKMFNRSCLAASFESLSKSTVSKDSALHDCVLDLTTTGDLQLVDVHCASYIAQTERNIRRDSVLRMNHSQEVQSFYALACINNCNGHGECINGTCSCHDPYIEQDCSISRKDLPVVLDTYGGGLCSRSSDECCGRLPMYGYRFVSGTTKQKLETFQVLDNGTMDIVETTVNDLQILNAFQADMIVPCHSIKRRSTNSGNGIVVLAYGVRVSLTNDGNMYGLARYFYTYDAQCQGYQLSSRYGYTFYIKVGKCYINGVCYSEGEKASADGCKQCRPGIDPYSFTGECSSTERKPSLSLEETVIIAPVVTVLAVIACVISILIVVKVCFKKKKRISGLPNSGSSMATPEKNQIW